MADAVIASTPDAWTPLQTDLRPFAEDVALQRFEEGTDTSGLNGQDFLTLPGEVDQFIKLAQLGWGAQLGSGKRIGYYQVIALLQNMLTAQLGRGVPRR
jgi:hypothetical protein